MAHLRSSLLGGDQRLPRWNAATLGPRTSATMPSFCCSLQREGEGIPLTLPQLLGADKMMTGGGGHHVPLWLLIPINRPHPPGHRHSAQLTRRFIHPLSAWCGNAHKASLQTQR